MRLTLTFVDFIMTMVVLFALQISIAQRVQTAPLPAWFVVNVHDRSLWLIGVADKLLKAHGPVLHPISEDIVSDCRQNSAAARKWPQSTELSVNDQTAMAAANRLSPDLVIGAGIDDSSEIWSCARRGGTSPHVILIVGVDQQKPIGQLMQQPAVTFRRSTDGAQVGFTLFLDNGTMKAQLYNMDPNSGSYVPGAVIAPSDIDSHFDVAPLSCTQGNPAAAVGVKL